MKKFNHSQDVSLESILATDQLGREQALLSLGSRKLSNLQISWFFINFG